MRLLPARVQRRHHASHAALELAILGGVDERVDAAVGERQDDGKVVEPIDKRGEARRVKRLKRVRDWRF